MVVLQYTNLICIIRLSFMRYLPSHHYSNSVGLIIDYAWFERGWLVHSPFKYQKPATGRNRGKKITSNTPDIRTRLSLGHGRNVNSHRPSNQLQVTTDLSTDIMNEVPTLVTPTNSRSEVNRDDVSAGMSRRTPNTFESGSAGTPRSVGGIKSSGMKGGARRVSANRGDMARDMHHPTPTLCTPSPRPSESFLFDRETKISSASVKRAQRSAFDKSSNASSINTPRNKKALLAGPKRILCAR